MALSAGEKLGPYEILSVIGAGGMGEVYKARDTRLERTVAVKVLPEHIAQREDLRARFEREARAVASLNHPNICVLHDIGSQDGTGYMVMEYMEGETLAGRIEKGALPLDLALKFATQIADALDRAHRAGVTHRDIKPQNIMLTRDGVKVLDFGLAKSSSKPAPTESTLTVLTTEGTVMGTPQYMAPEQFEGKEADARSDIWAFGAVLYEMVAGRKAFQGKSYSSLVGAILTADPPPMSMKPFTPAVLEKLVRRCLHKDPEDRYQSVRDVLLDLRSIAAQPDEVQTPAPAARVGYGVIVVAMAVIAAVAGFGWWRATRPVERPLVPFAIRSLAIMPLATVESTPDTEHLSEGLAESLTYSLAQVRDLRVMSRSAVLRQAMPRAGDAIAAGLALGVDGVVTGRISTQGGELAITVELVEVRSGRNVWGSRYTRKGSELQRLEEEVASEISEALRVKLSQAQQEQLERRNSHSGEAYNLYLKGRFFGRRRGPEDLRKAIEYFEQAIDRDPNYALAHAGLADTWLLGDHSIPPAETAPKAKRNAARAVQLDSRLAEGHVSMAMVKFVIDWDWQAAEAEFRRAIECDPNDVEAHRNFGTFQLRLGRTEKAMAEFLRATQLDPANTLAQLSLANALYWSGRYREAVAEFHKILEMNPDHSAAHIALGLALSEMGEHGEAVRELQSGLQRSPNDSTLKAALGYGLARAGMRTEAFRLARELEELRAQRYVSASNFSILYAGLRDKNSALRWAEKAFEQRDVWVVHLKGEPRLAMLRSEPRFQELLHKVGFP